MSAGNTGSKRLNGKLKAIRSFSKPAELKLDFDGMEKHEAGKLGIKVKLQILNRGKNCNGVLIILIVQPKRTNYE